MHAVWSEDHALAWHLEEKFRQDSATWALEKCLAWDLLEREHLPYFLNETIDCPCTLAQARADTGRFHVSMLQRQLSFRLKLFILKRGCLSVPYCTTQTTSSALCIFPHLSIVKILKSFIGGSLVKKYSHKSNWRNGI